MPRARAATAERVLSGTKKVTGEHHERRTPRPGAGSRSPARAPGSASSTGATPRTRPRSLPGGHRPRDPPPSTSDADMPRKSRNPSPPEQRRFALPGHRDHIAAELQGERFGHHDFLPVRNRSSHIRSQANQGQTQLMPTTIVNATVDRLLHHAHVVLTTGDSIRLTQATTGKRVKPLAN
jgi:hypothetical protein